ncbi:hypothetical protein BDQ12DRAFT_727763 [Crucibulum laeve]|uniref:BTB domain-containing protein n=1 Tax=Crucibulum laeve TaxID=68775 RepID=A0A5C3LXF0_9AGAR|nr:hypothetical protein BDQ12DRAFT_727763 [Crucibulum laeve]
MLSSDNDSHDQSTTSSDSESLKHRTATAPFDDSNAEIILRSSDNVDFHVHRLILSLASPVFETMFTLPQGNTDSPLVQMSEDSSTVDILLRYCYPTDVPEISDLGLLKKVMEAAMKFDMPDILKQARKQLLNFVEKEPLSIFALAAHYKWREGAKRAAKECLAFNLIGTHVDELNLISASNYHRLLEYHQRCGRAASKLTLLNEMGNADQLYSLSTRNCWIFCNNEKCPSRHVSGLKASDGKNRYMKEWFFLYLDAVRNILKDRPAVKLITPMALRVAAMKKAGECYVCRPRAAFDLDSFIIGPFSEEIEKAIDKIQLELEF